MTAYWVHLFHIYQIVFTSREIHAEDAMQINRIFQLAEKLEECGWKDQASHTNVMDCSRSLSLSRGSPEKFQDMGLLQSLTKNLFNVGHNIYFINFNL